MCINSFTHCFDDICAILEWKDDEIWDNDNRNRTGKLRIERIVDGPVKPRGGTQHIDIRGGQFKIFTGHPKISAHFQ